MIQRARLKHRPATRLSSRGVLSLGLAALACIASSDTLNAEWSTYQANAAHTGYVSTSLDFSQAAAPRWSTPLDLYPTIPGGLAVGANTVLVTGYDALTTYGLYALNAYSGAIVWDHTNLDRINPPAYANGKAYVVTVRQDTGPHLGGHLRAYDIQTGAAIFDTPISQSLRFLSPTPFGDDLYLGQAGGAAPGVYSYDGATGQLNWSATGLFDNGWTPAVDSQYVYSYTALNNQSPIRGLFLMVDRATGQPSYAALDSFDYGSFVTNQAVVLGPNHDAFMTDLNGHLIARDVLLDATHTPHIEWSKSGYGGQPVLADGVLYVTTTDGVVHALDELTGDFLWSWQAPGGHFAFVKIATDNALVVTVKDKFSLNPIATYALDPATHAPIWSYPLGGELALSDGILYVLNGGVTAFTVPEPRSLALAMLGGVVTLLACRRRRARRPLL
ncbi:MAG: PQQ-binding-like beta-propeller repeat protein [Pirellulales bacterium]|nr:PQQ-binding-like beta-propeller repeat protein [Pirellulales bacterium]